MGPAADSILGVLRQVKVGYGGVVRRLADNLLAHWVLHRPITVPLRHRSLLYRMDLVVAEGSGDLVIIDVRHWSKHNVQVRWRLLGGHLLFLGS